MKDYTFWIAFWGCLVNANTYFSASAPLSAFVWIILALVCMFLDHKLNWKN